MDLWFAKNFVLELNLEYYWRVRLSCINHRIAQVALSMSMFQWVQGTPGSPTSFEPGEDRILNRKESTHHSSHLHNTVTLGRSLKKLEQFGLSVKAIEYYQEIWLF